MTKRKPPNTDPIREPLKQPKKKRKTPRKRQPRPGEGRPPVETKAFRPQYCKDLISYLNEPGRSFESFGAFLYRTYGPEYGVGKDKLYEWVKEFPEFADSKRIGEGLSREYWDQLGQRGMTGQLRRVKSERPAQDKDGNIKYDAKGEIIWVREYEPAQFAQQTYRLMMGARFGVREQKSIEVTGADGGPIQTKEMSMTSKEKAKAARDILASLAMVDEDEEI